MKVTKIGMGKTEGVVLLFVDSLSDSRRFGDMSETEPNFCFGTKLAEQLGTEYMIQYVESRAPVCGFNDAELAETRAFSDYVETPVGDER